MIPMILMAEGMMSVGLVQLLGMMTGPILADASRLVAYQLRRSPF